MRALSILLLLTLLIACTERRGPIDLGALEGKARGGETAAVAELVDLLAVAENNVNGRAYQILVDLGDRAVPMLLAKVDSPDREQREHVIAALGNLKVKAALPAIIKVLGEPALGRRYVAAWALGEIDDPAAIPALVGALGDPDAEVRKYATRSLIKFNRQAVPALLAALPAASDLAGAGMVRALGDIADPAALDALLALVDGPNRREVFTALGKLRDPRAESALIAGLGDSDWQVRMNAAMALGPIGTPASIKALQRSMEDEVHVVREWSARSLEMIGGSHVKYRNEKGEYVAPYAIYH